MKVLVGVSGGVDSAVALHILKSQGHEIVGAMMKIYDGDIKTIANSCYGTDKIKEANYNVLSSEDTLVPDNYVDLDEGQLASFTKMINLLEDNDDVQEVIHNVNLPDEEEEE